jgi:branched-subunit amino acid ABC-type transport system permease component
LLTNIITQLFGALTSASLLFLVAAGLTLIFGAMQIINIAHGSFYMFGAFIVASLAGTGAASTGVGFWVAVILGPIVVGVIGALTEILILRRLYGKEHLLQLLATFGLLYFFEGAALSIWGSEFRSVSIPTLLQGHLSGAARSVPAYDLFILGVAVAVGVFMWWLLQRTQLGWRIRAAVEDPEMLAASGTNVSRLFTGVFALGALLAGIAGVIVGPIQSVTTGLSTQVLVEAFIVVVIGGLGSIPGAAIGAIVIGLFETIGITWMPSLASASIYIAMILVLIFRPTGLLGVAER